ncbi:histamine H4 receptor [Kogia breviceps]|uniref:histamine H4 receptor n=1 Tax=Kogia breviceps TaxID=27615 RepID=UPI002795E1CC|nr:histamine H4 receptor [Kogia breviceps]
MPATNDTTDLPSETSIALAFLMSLLTFAIMVGNAVVILSFVVDKNLRHQSNNIFLNLAISDFFVVSQAWKKGNGDCEPGFFTEWYILALMVLLEFMIPVLLMAYFNTCISWSLWKWGNLSRWHSRFTSVSSSSYGCSFRSGLFSRTSFSNPEEAAASLHSEKPRRKSRLLFSSIAQTESVTASKMESLSHSDSLVLQQREHLELCRGRKLAKSLAILLGVFAICWAPYSLFTIIRSISPTDLSLSATAVYEFTFWLQRFNSFDNPFLYPLCHKRFQKAFLKHKIYFV